MALDFADDSWEDKLWDRIGYWQDRLLHFPKLMATIDFETRSTVDLKVVGSWIYSKHPTTEAMCMAYHLPGDGDEVGLWFRTDLSNGIPESELPTELFAFILAGGLVEAHNSFFERMIWRHVMVLRHGWPEMPHLQWRCSASRTSAASLPRDLANACIAMGLDVKKDGEGRKLMLKMCKPRKPRKAETEDWKALSDDPMPPIWNESYEEQKRQGEYCQQDVRAEKALSDAIPELPPKELLLWQFDQKMNERGARFDLDMARSALKIAVQNKHRLNAELFEVTGILKATQRAQVKDWLAKHEGMELPDTTAVTLDKFLEREEEFSGRAMRILNIVKQVNRTSVRKYQTALDKCDPEDWRARDLLMFCGAGTGRWSAKGIQVQNFPRGLSKNDVFFDSKAGRWIVYFNMDTAAEDIKLGDEAWIEAMYEKGTIEGLSTALRGLVIPEEGHDLISADYSAIEARCVLWEAGDEDALEVFRSGGDIYCDMGEGIYGYPVNKKDHPDERQFGKQAILGLGYGMGFITFLITCKRYKIAFSVPQVKNILKHHYTEYMDWVTEYLFPVMDPENKDPSPEDLKRLSNKKRQASKNRRRLTDADQDPAALLHELALMKYTVDVYRKRYKPVKQMWADQEAAAIKATGQWQSLVRDANAQYKEFWGEDLPVSDRDLIDGPKIKAGMITWYVLGGFLCCELPSGRLIRYRDPSVKMGKTAWGSNSPSLRYMSMIQPGNRWGSTSTYGGKIVENITQGVARDVMADAMLRADKSIYKVIMTIHDEMVAEVPQGEGSLEEFEELMSETEEWAKGCPITAEAERYARYRK